MNYCVSEGGGILPTFYDVNPLIAFMKLKYFCHVTKSKLQSYEKAVSCLFAASLVLSSYAINNNDKEYYLAEEHIKNLPEAPKGYKWVVNEDYTDEFNGRR